MYHMLQTFVLDVADAGKGLYTDSPTFSAQFKSMVSYEKPSRC